MNKLDPKRIVSLSGVALVFIGFVVGVLTLASYVETSTAAQSLVAQFGYVGVAVLAVISGLNVIVPLPAATFVPTFLAAGLAMPFIVLALAAGTLVADLIGYLLGSWSKQFVVTHYPRTYNILANLRQKHSMLIVPCVFFYAAFIPFPNETLLVPLAVMGVPLRTLVLPLFSGALVSQLLFSYGFESVFELLF